MSHRSSPQNREVSGIRSSASCHSSSSSPKLPGGKPKTQSVTSTCDVPYVKSPALPQIRPQPKMDPRAVDILQAYISGFQHESIECGKGITLGEKVFEPIAGPDSCLTGLSINLHIDAGKLDNPCVCLEFKINKSDATQIVSSIVDEAYAFHTMWFPDGIEHEDRMISHHACGDGSEAIDCKKSKHPELRTVCPDLELWEDMIGTTFKTAAAECDSYRIAWPADLDAHQEQIYDELLRPYYANIVAWFLNPLGASQWDAFRDQLLIPAKQTTKDSSPSPFIPLIPSSQEILDLIGPYGIEAERISRVEQQATDKTWVVDALVDKTAVTDIELSRTIDALKTQLAETKASLVSEREAYETLMSAHEELKKDYSALLRHNKTLVKRDNVNEKAEEEILKASLRPNGSHKLKASESRGIGRALKKVARQQRARTDEASS